MTSHILHELQEAIAKEWDKMAESGKIFIDSGEALTRVKDTKVALYMMPISELVYSKTDILIGFYATPYARKFKNEIEVSIQNKVVSKEIVLRGRKKFIDQPIPIVALRKEPGLRVASYFGMYAICAACDNPYRLALVQNKLVWGRFWYENDVLKDFDASCGADYDDVVCLSVKPNFPVFGGLILGGSTFDSNNNYHNTDNDVYEQLLAEGHIV